MPVEEDDAAVAFVARVRTLSGLFADAVDDGVFQAKVRVLGVVDGVVADGGDDAEVAVFRNPLFPRHTVGVVVEVFTVVSEEGSDVEEDAQAGAQGKV